MIRDIYLQLQLTQAQSINRLIYSLKSIKGIGNLISDEWYVRADIKKVLGIISIIYMCLSRVFLNACFFGGVIVGSNVLIADLFDHPSKQNMTMMFLSTFFFLNCMLGSYVNSMITTEGEEKDYVFLSLMRIEPKMYYMQKVVKKALGNSLIFFFCFWICNVLILQQSLLWVIIISFAYIAFQFTGECRRLRNNEKYGMPFTANAKRKGTFYFHNSCMVVLAFALYPAIYIASTFDVPAMKMVLKYYPNALAAAGLMGILIGAIAVHYLLKYPHYKENARVYSSMHAVIKANDEKKEIENQQISLNEKEIAQIKTNHSYFAEKKGYDYITAIFFDRYKSLVRNHILFKWIAEMLAFGGIAIFLVVLRVIKTPEDITKFSNTVWKDINSVLAWLVIIMYFFSSGEALTKTFFMNCDVSFLKFGFYRSAQSIRKMFLIRLKYMIGAEKRSMCTVCAGVIINSLLLGKQEHYLQILSIMASACILSIFFSFVYLCLYYLFQPYTEGGDTVGFAYKFLRVSFFVAAYQTSTIRVNSVYFAPIIMLITTVIMVIGYLLTWKLAPKTFHLK